MMEVGSYAGLFTIGREIAFPDNSQSRPNRIMEAGFSVESGTGNSKLSKVSPPVRRSRKEEIQAYEGA